MSEKNENVHASTKSRVLTVLGYVATGVLVTLILTGLKTVIENTSWGRENRMWVFGKLQTPLSSIDPKNPIVLIDLSDVPDEEGGKPALTDTIQEIVGALVHLEKRPLAIAVDVDFSPSPTGKNSAENAEFFDFCLEAGKKVPICLAVGDNKAAAPHQWLGNEKYKDLACAVALDADDTRKIPLWVRADNQPQALNTLNYALALQYRKQLPEPHRWINWAVDRSEEEDDRNVESRKEIQPDETKLIYGERLVNYSKLEAMKQAAKKDTSAQSITNTGSAYGHKLIILGDVSKPKDFFPVPGNQHNQAGSLILASATYTLIKEPLFEFKHSVTMFLDFLIAGLIIIAVAVIRYRNPHSLFWFGRQALFIYLSIGFVLAAGVLLVWLAGVMWLDFLLVAFALSLHPKLEQLLHKIFRRRESGTAAAPTPTPPTPPEEQPIVFNPAILMIVTTLIFAPTVQAQEASTLCQERVAAIALKLKVNSKANKKAKKDTCHFRDNKEAESHALAATDMNKKAFSAGQQLYCDKNCVLTVWLCDTQEEHEVTENLPKWYSVFHPYRAPRRIIDPYQDKPAREVKKASFRAGNPRTTKSRLADINFAAAAAVDSKIAAIGIAKSTGTSTAGATATLSGRTATTHSETLAARRENQKILEEKEELESRFIALLVKANHERDAKNFSKAEQYYGAAVKLIPDDSRSFYGLGNVYSDQQKWKEAEDAYRRAVSLVPDSADDYVALAVMLMEPREGAITRERMAEAEDLLKSAAGMQREDEKVYELLYKVLEMRGATNNDFEATYRRMLRLNPRSIRTNLRLSALLHRSGRRGEAKDHLKIAEQAASSSQDLLEVAEVFESQGHYDKAERSIRRALTLNPRSPRVLLILGLVLIDKERYAQAMGPLQLAVEASQNDFVPRYLLGIAQLRSGNLEAAERSFDTAIQKSTKNGEELFATACWLAILGDTYSMRGRTYDALRAYEKALGYDPEDSETKGKLSEMRARLKR